MCCGLRGHLYAVGEEVTCMLRVKRSPIYVVVDVVPYMLSVMRLPVCCR